MNFPVVEKNRNLSPLAKAGTLRTLLVFLFCVSLFNAGCKKDIEEPKHKNKGKNVIYLKIDEQEFLIKEGFSLNRNVIKAEIVGQGPKGRQNPTYFEDEYFGKKYSFLSINHEKKNESEYFGRGIWDISFYESGELGQGLPNGILMNFYSEKHSKWITFNTDGNGWNGEYLPIVNILHHNKKEQTISGIYQTNYFDNLDTNLTGKIYMYFDIKYDKL